MLQVEADDIRWQQLLLPPPGSLLLQQEKQQHQQQQQKQQYLGCTCSVEDCRLFLLSIHRTDALAALLQVPSSLTPKPYTLNPKP